MLACIDRYDYAELFDSVLDAAEVWAENMSYDTRFEQQRELEKTQMKVAVAYMSDLLLLTHFALHGYVL